MNQLIFISNVPTGSRKKCRITRRKGGRMIGKVGETEWNVGVNQSDDW
jgi:hypothetical protein